MKICLNVKHDDRGSLMIINDAGTVVYESHDGIPYFGILGGDYTKLEIDNDTGKILNWKPIEVKNESVD